MTHETLRIFAALLLGILLYTLGLVLLVRNLLRKPQRTETKP